MTVTEAEFAGLEIERPTLSPGYNTLAGAHAKGPVAEATGRGKRREVFLFEAV